MTYSRLLKYKNPLALVVIALVVTGCASQPSLSNTPPAGFLLGFFHGFTIFFSLIGSTFMDVRIYAYPNTGFVYDIGYFLGASTFLGAGGVGGARAKKD